MAKGEHFELNVLVRGYNEAVTGSAIENIVRFPDKHKYRFLVDHGFYQGKGYGDLSYNDRISNIPKIDAVFLTHSHLDHYGALPMLYKQGYVGKIYTSKSTSHLLEIGFEDNLGIIAEIAKNKKVPRLYKEADVEKVFNNIVECDYGIPVEISPGITVTFLKNAHLVGASLILVQISYPNSENINILYTGDYKDENIFSGHTEIPCWVYDLDNLTIVTESTYGTTDTSDISYILEDILVEYCNQNKTIVIPSFGQGRYQEMLYLSKKLKENNLISRDYQIKADGKSGINYTFRYINDKTLEIKDEMRDFLPENLEFVTNISRPSILKNNSGKIIITTSGMGNHGPACTYLSKLISDDETVVIFPGYTADESLGRRLQETEYGELVWINSDNIPRRAKIFSTSECSSHAKGNEILAFINKFKRPRSVLITHGEPMVREKFATRVLNSTSVKRVGVLGKGYSYRIGPYGIIKAILK